MNIPAIRWMLVAACMVAVAAAAGSYEDEYEDEEPAAPPPSPKLRPSLLSSRQARGPIVPGRPSPKNTVTQKTTTTTEAPAEYEDEEGEGEELNGGEEDHQSTTSEAPKRGGLKNGVVRPFRSNADLLETLKKRRQQQGSGHHAAPSTTSTTTSAPQEKSYNKGGRRPGKVADQTGSNSDRKNTFNRSNSRLKSAPSTSEPVVEQAEEQPRTRSFRARKF